MSAPLINTNVLGPVKLRYAEVRDRFPKLTHFYGGSNTPDHNNRRCIDAMVVDTSREYQPHNLSRTEQVELGDAVAAYLWENRKRLALVWLIWNRRALRTYGKTINGKHYPAGTWSPYFGPNPHEDHVHFETGASAYVPPSGPAPTPTPPPPWSGSAADFPGREAFVVGEDHAAVTMLDKRLIAWGFTAANDGDGYQPGPTFTEHTRLNVQSFQLAQGWTGDDADGYPGPVTWSRLMADPPADAGTGTVTIRVTSTNMLDDNVDKRHGWKHPWSKRKAGYLAAMKSTRPDLILVQEATTEQMDDLATGLGPDWTWWRSGPLSIAHDMGKLTRTDDGTALTLTGGKRRAIAVRFVHRTSGKPFTAVCTHLVNEASNAGLRLLQATQIRHWLPSGPIVFGGDLNSSLKAGPRAELRSAGLVFIRNAVSVAGAQFESHHGFASLTPDGSWIDDMGTRGLKVVEAALIRTDKAAPTKAHRNVSDHNMLRLVAEL